MSTIGEEKEEFLEEVGFNKRCIYLLQFSRLDIWLTFYLIEVIGC